MERRSNHINQEKITAVQLRRRSTVDSPWSDANTPRPPRGNCAASSATRLAFLLRTHRTVTSSPPHTPQPVHNTTLHQPPQLRTKSPKHQSGPRGIRGPPDAPPARSADSIHLLERCSHLEPPGTSPQAQQPARRRRTAAAIYGAGGEPQLPPEYNRSVGGARLGDEISVIGASEQ